MKPFTVKLTLSINAKDVMSAYDIGVDAVEHLLDTFSDNESISPLVDIEANPENG